MKTEEIMAAFAGRTKPTGEAKRRAENHRADWWKIENAAGDSKTATLYLYDVIGVWYLDTDAQSFATALSKLDVDEIVVRINSPGGAVFEGFAIYNLLRDHKAKITTKVDGLAASIASVIALAGDEIEIADNGMMMIHNPSGMAWGEAKDLRKTADILDQVKTAITATYTARTKVGGKDLAAMMDSETWFGAEDAISKGFATKKGAAPQMAALWNAADLDNLPEAAKALCYRELDKSDPKEGQDPAADLPEPEHIDPPAPKEPEAKGGTLEDVAAAEALLAAVTMSQIEAEGGFDAWS